MRWLFSADGRIGRFEFFVREWLSWLVMAIGMAGAVSAPSSSAAPVLLGLVAMAGALSMWVTIFRRLHDMGRPATNAWRLFVPVLNIFWFFDLWQRPGDPGVNAYGPPPTHAFGLRLPASEPPI